MHHKPYFLKPWHGGFAGTDFAPKTIRPCFLFGVIRHFNMTLAVEETAAEVTMIACRARRSGHICSAFAGVQGQGMTTNGP